MWCGIAFVGSGMAGCVFGIWEARPVINILALVGAVAVAAATITVTAIAAVSLRSHWLHLSMSRLPVAPRIGLIWSGIAIVASINVGAFLGFTFGLRTAQSVADILSGVGIVVMLVAAVAVLAGITYKGRTHYRRNRRR